jgi:hypothetical protein
MMNYKNEIENHYKSIWGDNYTPRYWYKGPIHKLNPDFCILEFTPSSSQSMWIYATCCMSNLNNDKNQVELHLFSSEQDHSLIELLTAVAAYHCENNSNRLGLHHTVNFGRPWQKESICDYGFISLPYLDGPKLENGKIDNHDLKFYWLIPVSKREVEFKKEYGVDSLEDKFETLGLDYINPSRESLV